MEVQHFIAFFTLTLCSLLAGCSAPLAHVRAAMFANADVVRGIEMGPISYRHLSPGSATYVDKWIVDGIIYQQLEVYASKGDYEHRLLDGCTITGPISDFEFEGRFSVVQTDNVDPLVRIDRVRVVFGLKSELQIGAETLPVGTVEVRNAGAIVLSISNSRGKLVYRHVETGKEIEVPVGQGA